MVKQNFVLYIHISFYSKTCKSICLDKKCYKSRSSGLESVHDENDVTSHAI